MNNRLSYSQLRLYSQCGKRYEYHYVHKLREKTKSGALFFGTAFDKAVEAALQYPEKGIENDKKVFDSYWTNQPINGRPVYIPDSSNVVYSSSDCDLDLLKDEDLRFLEAKLVELKLEGTVAEAYAAAAASKKQQAFKRWPENSQKFHRLCNWFSLRNKGHLMLEAHREKVMPRIKKVIATQKKIELTNDNDTLIGFIDLIATWEDGRTVIFDYKTSSIEYEKDSVLTGTQLTLYSHSEHIKTCGYIVFRKQVLKNKVKICSKCAYDGSKGRHKTCPMEPDGKRCGGDWRESISPEIDIQIIIDDIPERTKDIVLENVEATNAAIHNNIFTRNFDSCIQPWGKCPYFQLCFKNSEEGLEKEIPNEPA